MNKVLKLVGYHGPQLWTRELAQRIGTDVVGVLKSLDEGSYLVLDCEDVEVFDYSFANELFGRTALRLPREFPGRFVIVDHLTEYTRENLQQALDSLSLMMIERGDGGELRLLGKVHPVDQATFAAIVNSKSPALAAELKEVLNVSVTAMNERLSKLADVGVIRRQKSVSPAGREQYAYSVPR